jgi:hypothetical protein
LSAIPQELRDAVVRQLEEAVEDRDRNLARVTGEVQSLRRAIGETEGILERQRQLLRSLEEETRRSGEALDRESRRAVERLQELGRRAEEQQRKLAAALQAAERRHRHDRDELRRQIGQLAQDRKEREDRIRQAACQAAERSEQLLARIAPEEAERLDLVGPLTAARSQLAGARALAADPQVPAAEALTAAYGAEEALRQVEAMLAGRDATLTALSEQFRGDAERLRELLRGDPVLGLPCQAEDAAVLLRPEQGIMGAVIERQLAGPAAGLRRWNGHAAQAVRLAAVRDLLGAEILAARKALEGAAAQELARYDLSHIWDDLELQFGAIRERGADTPGAWLSEADRKSTYLYFLESQRGELWVEVGWGSDIVVHHRGLPQRSFPPALAPNAGAVHVGGLARRWSELAARLDNPTWTPDG